MAALEREPGFHNVLGLERAWSEDRLLMDFLDPDSPIHHLKRLSTAIYAELAAPLLTLSNGSLLDAGCGIGRFTTTAAATWRRVTAFDACRSSLNACAWHLGAAPNVRLRWADSSVLEETPRPSFDGLISTEFIGYLGDPARALDLMLRTAKPGAMVFISVEARPGGLTHVTDLTPAQVEQAAAGEPLLVPEDRYVNYFSLAGFRDLIDLSGLREARIEASHFFRRRPILARVGRRPARRRGLFRRRIGRGARVPIQP
ncbi:MAG: class I SAM-dependent methyltransferase [Deltaproteobacteria bacterium]|nr:class I SAM-dependent methyltransferase [Deltaproteobacteria bacterium]